MLQAPVDGPDDNRQAGSQLAVEDLDCDQIRVWIQMVDARGNSGTVAQGIFIPGHRAVRGDRDAVDNLPHVWMRAAYPAIQNADAHWQTHAVTRADSSTHPSSRTTTISANSASDMRWVMRIEVRPRKTFISSLVTAASEAESSAEGGSSRISILGSRSN